MNLKGKIKKKSNRELERVILGLKDQLNKNDFRVELKSNQIFFQKIYRSTTSLRKNKREAFNLLKNGSLEIKKIDNQHLLILYACDINFLLFFSILSASMITFLFGFHWGASMTKTIIIASIMGLSIFRLGRLFLKIQISNIIDRGVFSKRHRKVKQSIRVNQ